MSAISINIYDYNYSLPEDKIAKYPLNQRDKSKLLVYEHGNISEKVFEEITDFFSEKDLIIFNETKVIQARLEFERETGARIEIFCLEPYLPADYEQNFQSSEKCLWKCTVGNLKKWKEESLRKHLFINNKHLKISAKIIQKGENSQIIEFTWNEPDVNFGQILENAGQTPIPPYLKRNAELSDKERYQTVYSKNKGSVAAPTAGLHFTENVISYIKKKGAKTDYLTLHVGAGTFRPVKSENIFEHEMHSEHFSISKQTIELLIKYCGNITATGTTTVRTLESLYWLGVKLILQNNTNLAVEQWEVYELKNENILCSDSLNAVLIYLNKNNLDRINASTKIIITPGYKFKIVNKLVTNFHQPQSTLLLLVSAFIGENWKKVYDYALQNNFRFLSYGDSSILIP